LKKILILLILLLASGGAVFYGLGVGKGDAEKGTPAQERRGERRSGGGGGRSVSVEVAKVEVGEAEEKLSYGGSLMAKSSVDLLAKVEGRLESLAVDVGDWVKEGELIARIEKDEIAEVVREAEAALEVAQATLRGKEVEMKNLARQLERAEELLKRQLIARQEFDTVQTQSLTAQAQTDLARAQVAQRRAILQNAQIRLSHTEVHSPISGYVGKKLLDRGAMVKGNTPIVSLVSLDPVRTVISLVEKDYARVNPGLEAAIAIDAYPGQSFVGRVVRVSPIMDRDTRTADIEIEIPNRNKVLKPGMFARVSLTLERKERRFLVPQAALVRTNDAVGVYKVERKQRRVKFTPVEIGITDSGNVEVIRGVAEGDLVVTYGAQFLKDGARVQISGGSGASKSEG
jgi:RND family efflux transporter MFP subunit